MHELSSSDIPVSWDLLDRYYAGEVTSEEARLVRAYLSTRPDHERVLGQLLGAVRRSSADVRPANVAAMLAAVHERIAPSAILRRVVRTLFDGSVERAVAALLALDDTQLSAMDIEHLRQLINQAKQEGR
jgi:hypothetical protein